MAMLCPEMAGGGGGGDSQTMQPPFKQVWLHPIVNDKAKPAPLPILPCAAMCCCTAPVLSGLAVANAALRLSPRRCHMLPCAGAPPPLLSQPKPHSLPELVAERPVRRNLKTTPPGKDPPHTPPSRHTRIRTRRRHRPGGLPHDIAHSAPGGCQHWACPLWPRRCQCCHVLLHCACLFVLEGASIGKCRGCVECPGLPPTMRVNQKGRQRL